MAILKRAAVAAPAALAREPMPVPELGGDVIVAELLLDQRLNFEDTLAGLGAVKGRRAVNVLVPELLALAVLVHDDDGAEVPLFTVEQWRAWGAKNRDAAINLFNTAMRVNGFGGEGETAKN